MEGGMTDLPPRDGVPAAHPAWKYARVAARLVLGYVLAIGAGSVVFALLLQLPPDFENPHLPHSATTTVQLMVVCFVLGGIFGLPYTILGSLGFWFLLPRRTPIFLVIGAFCPLAALQTLELFSGGTLRWEITVTLLSIPAGLIAAYFYGAVGFGRGFGRWRFA
jgi:hypothetical protein